MFLNGTSGYGRDGDQKARGRFLMLFCEKPGGEIRALVRHVNMSQCGHFMMGRITIKDADARAENEPEPEYKPSYWMRRVFDGHYKLTLSGTYGQDGLTLDAERYPGLWQRLHPMPADLQEVFWKGGGHNSAGSEGPAVAEWAKTNMGELAKLRPVRTDGATPSQEVRP